nr:GIY-YIG nuclease family protein [Streptomyces sp. SID4982]
MPPPQFVSERAINESRLVASLTRAALLDQRLSPEAKGVLCSITEVSGSRGIGMAEICALSSGGAVTAERSVRELVDGGYLVRHTSRNPDGTMNGNIYQPAGGDYLGRSVTGFAYAIGTPDHKLVKIGCTGSPRKRLAALQTGSPVPLSIIWLQVGGYELEQHLHRTLAGRRLRGEWFDFSIGAAVWIITRVAEMFEPSRPRGWEDVSHCGHPDCDEFTRLRKVEREPGTGIRSPEYCSSCHPTNRRR